MDVIVLLHHFISKPTINRQSAAVPITEVRLVHRLLSQCGPFFVAAALTTVLLAAEPPLLPKRAWGPEQATGAPDTPGAGDQATAWASATQDGDDEWLELEYAAPVVAESVLIHEVYNPGAVFKVVGYTESGMEAELWTGKDPTPRDADKGVSEIDLKGKLETKRIRLHIKSKDVPGYNEIDAVGLKDAQGKVHWAVAAKASSTYAAAAGPAVGGFGGPFAVGRLLVPLGPAAPAVVGVGKGKRSWGPEQALGEPDTKVAGDITTAWASSTPDGADEWLELEYAEAAKIETVQIFETYNPGAVYKVTGFNDAGKEEDLWEGKDPTDPKKEMGTSEIPVKGKLKTKRIRVYLKSKEFAGYNEIDAVGVKDAAGKVQWAIRATASTSFAERGFGGFVGDDLLVPIMDGAKPDWAGPEVGDARIDKLESDVAELKKTLEEIRKLLEKPRK